MNKPKKQLVKEILIENTSGLTIGEISSKLKISRNTAAVALAELKGEGKVRIREIGMAKLHYWESRKKQ